MNLISSQCRAVVVHFAASTTAGAWVNVIDKADSLSVHVPAMWSKPGNVREPDVSTTKFETGQSTCHWGLAAHPY